MKLYVAIVNDRHAEPEPYVFSTAEAAIAYARAEAIAYAYDPLEVVEESIDGWLFHARYSAENDAVWVVEKELDGELEPEQA